MKRLLFCALLALTACHSEVRAPDRTTLPTPAALKTFQVQEPEVWTLDNQLTVWFLPDHRTPLAIAKLILPTGAATDPVEKAGLLSITASMLDEGAGDKDALTIDRFLQNTATDYGSSVSTDKTTLSFDFLSENVNSVFALLSDFLQKPQFNQKDFDRVIKKAQAQAQADEDDLGDVATLVMRKALFGNGYGSNPPSGTTASLKRITLDDVRACHQAAFSPEKATLLVTGDLDRKTLEQALEPLRNWKGQPKLTSADVTEPPPAAGLHFVAFPGSTQSMVLLAHRVPGNADVSEEAIKARFADGIFNQPFGSKFMGRLNMNLREDKGYTYGAHARFLRWNLAGMFMLKAQVEKNYTRATVDEMLSELMQIVGDKPITETEYQEGVDDQVLSLPMSFETLSSRADMFAQLIERGYSTDYWNRYTERTRAVTLQDAQASAMKNARGEDFIVVIAGDPELLPSLEGLGLKITQWDRQGNIIPSK